MTIASKIVEMLIRASQYTPLRGNGGYSCEALNASGESSSKFPQAAKEASQFMDFVALFESSDLLAWFRDKDVLDLGCGYGGKTVELMKVCHARQVYGIEPFEKMIELSRLYANSQDAKQCHFKVCSQYEIPFDSNSFDAIVSHDVLEHVADPRKTISEIYRVLRPGGRAFIIYPPYHGIMSHHLDYITRIPALHLLFSADAIIEAVNNILVSPEGKKYFTNAQPAPVWSYNLKRKCLPTLNGMTSREFMEMIGKFEVVQLKQRPLFYRYRYHLIGRVVLLAVNAFRRLSDLPRDVFSSSLICVLKKKDISS